MANEITGLTSKQLSRAAALQGKIEILQKRLSGILGAAAPVLSEPARPRRARAGKRKKMSAAARAKISAGQKARWAKRKKAKKAAKSAPTS